MHKLPDGYVLTPMNRLDTQTGSLIHAAQTEAQARGHYAALSDLILLVAVAGNDDIGDVLRQSLPEVAAVRDAVDAEWGEAPVDDRPRDAIRKAIFAAVARIEPNEAVTRGTFIAELLRLPDCRASRVLRRLGADPAAVADRLDLIG